MNAHADPDTLAAGDHLFAQPWSFLKSVAALDGLPPSGPLEIAFAGRSNVGKSSLINALTRRHDLARTSNTPGRTQQLNFFVAPGVPLTLVDMPGYGFAKAPKPIVEAWTGLVTDYLKGRPALARVFLLIDARHGIKAIDRDVMRLLDEAAVSYQIVLTKADKVKPSALDLVVSRATATFAEHPAAFPDLLVTSAAIGQGIPELRAAIARLLAEREPAASSPVSPSLSRRS
jgi:GTP-binding protein